MLYVFNIYLKSIETIYKNLPKFEFTKLNNCKISINYILISEKISMLLSSIPWM